MSQTPTILLIAEHKPGRAARGVAALGFGGVAGAARWLFLSVPVPTQGEHVLIALLALAGLAGVWAGTRTREVVVNLQEREVLQRRNLLGLRTSRRWPLDAFESVVVEQLSRSRGSAVEASQAYVVSLEGESVRVVLQELASVGAAERWASELARRMKLLPRRQGYGLNALRSAPQAEPSQIPKHLLDKWQLARDLRGPTGMDSQLPDSVPDSLASTLPRSFSDSR